MYDAIYTDGCHEERIVIERWWKVAEFVHISQINYLLSTYRGIIDKSQLEAKSISLNSVAPFDGPLRWTFFRRNHHRNRIWRRYRTSKRNNVGIRSRITNLNELQIRKDLPTSLAAERGSLRASETRGLLKMGKAWQRKPAEKSYAISSGKSRRRRQSRVFLQYRDAWRVARIQWE